MNLTDAAAVYAGTTEAKAVYYGPSLLWNVAGWEPPAYPASLLDGLAAFYRLDDFADSSGNNLNLAPVGTPIFSPGKIGNACAFDGATRFSVPVGGFAYNFTFSCWAKMTGGSSGPVVVGATNEVSISFRETQIGGFIFGTGVFQTNTTYQLGEWYHVVIVNSFSSGNYFKAYVNGVEGYSRSRISRMNGAKTILIGGEASGMFTGEIDAVGVWTRALTGTEILALYNSGSGVEI